MERLFGLDLQLIHDTVLTAIAMFVLFTFLSYMLFEPVRNMLKKRQEKVTADRDTAIKEKEDAMQLKAEYEEKLKSVQAEADAILSDARKRALKQERAIEDAAREEAARIIAQANAETELSRKKAMDELKQEVVAIATMMAGKVVAASMDVKIQDALIEETLKEMGDSTWRS